MTQSSIKKQRLRRQDSFFGVHFDFHANEESREVGKNTTPEMVAEVITTIRPDYIQCDCKGHPGISSYPTKVGHAVADITGDPLRIWRDVTNEHGVALYMHYSGVWDTAAISHHPEWAQIAADGTPSKDITSVFSAYVDELLIPQLKELCDEYGVDGVWVDGDCWATLPDYGEVSAAAFREQYGVTELPRNATDPYYFEFMQFSREAFRTYLRHYVDVLHAHNPNFQIASNWHYSSFAPEPVEAHVDFLSGDLTLQNAVTAARLESRCLAKQGKPWDLMAWGFGGHWGGHAQEAFFTTKTALQLQQEAAIVISQGGGFQAYFTQKKDGAINRSQLKMIGEVGEFCRARQPYCFQAESIPQIALLYPSSALYRQSRVLFGLTDDVKPMRGVLQCLLENQQVVDIELEHTLPHKLEQYPLVVLPEWPYLAPETKQQLLGYVAEGGNLLLVGPQSAALFADEMGMTAVDQVEKVTRWLHHEGELGVVHTEVQRFVLSEQARVVGKLYHEMDVMGANEVAAAIVPYKKGRIAATFFQFGLAYLNATTTVTREFVGALVKELFPEPIVEVSGSHYLDVVVKKLDGMLHVHLINAGGPHANAQVYTFDELPALGPVKMKMRCEQQPKEIRLEPEGVVLPFTYEDGVATVLVEKVALHDIVRVVE